MCSGLLCGCLLVTSSQPMAGHATQIMCFICDLLLSGDNNVITFSEHSLDVPCNTACHIISYSTHLNVIECMTFIFWNL